jgi:adenylate cyclase
MRDGSAGPTAVKPSIAVLPFGNISDDRRQNYFAEGLTDDLITELSKISGLLVIARNSTFAFKDQPKDVRTVRRTIGRPLWVGGQRPPWGRGGSHQCAADRRHDGKQRLGGAL